MKTEAFLSDQVKLSQTRHAGRIWLNSSKMHNALTHEMVVDLSNALDFFETDSTTVLVMLASKSEEVFCSGEDLVSLYSCTQDGSHDGAIDFWLDEFRLRAKIADCSKPVVALMNGLVSGASVGLTSHAGYRVVSETSQIAMTGCGIGLVPSSGTSFHMARSPGHLGEFLGMTGWQMSGEDAIFAGFAEFFVRLRGQPTIERYIEDCGDLSVLYEFLPRNLETNFRDWQATIDVHFGKETALECLLSLESDSSLVAREAARRIRMACPLSVAITFAMIRNARNLDSVSDAQKVEFGIVNWLLKNGDIFEGVRAHFIDKDMAPKWRYRSLEQVPEDLIAKAMSFGHTQLVPNLSKISSVQHSVPKNVT